MKFAIFPFLFFSAAYGQTITIQDASMEPLLVAAQSYSVQSTTVFPSKTFVVFPREQGHVARTIAAQPFTAILTADADFSLRAQATWEFFDLTNMTITWLNGDFPFVSPPANRDDLAVDNTLLEVSFSTLEIAPVLGDSLYYVHALNRPAIPDGATRTAAQGADSREWGTIHARDFVGIIEIE